MDLQCKNGEKIMPPRIDLPIEEIVESYNNGEQLIHLAEVYGVTRTTIRNRLIEAGVKESGLGHIISGASNPGWKGGKRSYYLLRAQESIIANNIDLHTCSFCETYNIDNKNRFPIHHIDGDRQNNSIDNLVVLCVSCHTRLHVGIYVEET